MTTPATTPAATTTPAAAPAAAAAAATATPAAAAAPAAGATGEPAAAATPAATPAPAQAAAAPAAAAAAPTTTPATPAVPERYELTLPQGSPLDQSDLDAVAALGKAKGWTQEAAAAALQEMHDHTVAQASAFLSKLQAHPEVGGANLEAAQINANRALDRFLPASTPEGAELRTAMKKSGYSNYAPLVVLLNRIGKAMGEDRPLATSSTTSTEPRDPATVLYGGTPQGS